jgi:hypothetical protein
MIGNGQGETEIPVDPAKQTGSLPDTPGWADTENGN